MISGGTRSRALGLWDQQWAPRTPLSCRHSILHKDLTMSRPAQTDSGSSQRRSVTPFFHDLSLRPLRREAGPAISQLCVQIFWRGLCRHLL